MDVRDGLFALGIKRDQVHFELFTTSEGKKARNERQEKQNETVPNKTMEIVLDGKTMLMDFRKDDDNILDKALLQGADLLKKLNSKWSLLDRCSISRLLKTVSHDSDKMNIKVMGATIQELKHTEEKRSSYVPWN